MKLPIPTIYNRCASCGKQPGMALTRPHSLHKTKRVVRPNLGRWQGLTICAKCRKAMTKPEHLRLRRPMIAPTPVTPS